MNIFPKKLEASHLLFLVIGFALAMLVNKPKVIEGGGCDGRYTSDTSPPLD